MDGVLDEPFWADIPPVTGFKQRDPVDGAPASERTEVRIAYDEDALYFGFTFFDSEPDRINRAILHRGGRIDKDDRVIIGLDTYFDRRNGYIFEVGALGTQDDAIFADENLVLDDWSWDGVFTTETRVTEDGWVLEMEIPFTTIRFADVEEPVMGIAFQRSIRRKNETVIWPHIGQDFKGHVAQASQYATLTGLKDVRRGHRLEVKPYANLGAQQQGGQDGFDRESRAGLDLKYGVTPNLTLDLTWNTDFAQVETDNVQINLTRFDLFFPEKREFFLERAGLFEFGTTQETEVFFSRRIGLEDDILGGGRLTGQAGPISVGALALRTESRAPEVDGAGAWNSVVRLQANLHERTTVGVIGTSLDADGSSDRTAGADFVTRFWGSSQFRMWGARVWDSEATGAREGTSAARAELELQNDRYGVRVRRTHVGKAFSPALGFVRRRDQDQWYLWTAFTPRFEASDWARRSWVWVGGERILGTDGELQSRQAGSHLGFEFESGESVSFDLDSRFERLHGPASISGRVLSPGDYRFTSYQLGAKTNDSRVFSGFLSGSTGSFWGGDRSQVRTGVSLKTGPHLTIGAQVSRNQVSLPVPDGDFTTTLVGVNIQGAVSRKLFAGALVQWDNLSKELQANIRVDWIHTPGSDLFLVLDTGYITDDTLDPRLDPWTRRTAVAKLTWLKAF
ncbi:MAG: DUF5916 domain-containing protein [Acidobacteria bacterium]|nr:DUF5916 domain-containing protein [Acidobacteriota bacterium]